MTVYCEFSTWKRLACGAVLLGATSAQAAEAAGYVLAVEGQWFVAGAAAPLMVGAPVEAGATIVARDPAATDRLIVLAARSGTVLLSVQCGDAASCKDPVAVPDVVATRRAGGNWGGTIEKVLTRVAGEPERYASGVSRRPLLLKDAVLKVDQGRIDFGPLFAPLPAGTYEVVLSKFNCNSAKPCVQMPLSLRFTWSPSNPLSPPVAGLDPGLYDLNARSERGGPDAVQARNWTLLVPQSELVGTAQRYSAALSLVDSWGQQVDSATKRSFARATLDALSER